MRQPIENSPPLATLSTEARTLVNLLEQAHYNRDAVTSADFGQVIPSYMYDLDGQRLFFLDSDRKNFEDLYGKNIYWNISALGNIDPAYEIFQTYETRANARINWIFAELKKDFDLSGNDTYAADRSKAEWPASAEAADELWRRRLKFELISEMMNKKTLEEAKAGGAEAIRAHDEERRRNRRQRSRGIFPLERRADLRSTLHVFLRGDIRRLRNPDEAAARRDRRVARDGRRLLLREGDRARRSGRSGQTAQTKRQDHRRGAK